MTVFVAMDSVLVNLNKALARLLAIEYPHNATLYPGWAFDQSGVNGKASYRLLNLESARLWSEAEEFPWTGALIGALDVHAPGWKIITQAISNPACWQGKALWVNRRHPILKLNQLVVTGGPPYETVSRGEVLVAAHRELTDAWRQRGGLAFDWLEYAEGSHHLAALQIEKLIEFLINLENKRKS